jgi:prephenate dehydrogenase
MNVAIIGKGLIGGSLEKAALRAKYDVEIFRGRGPIPDLSRFNYVFLAVPPLAVEGLVRAIAKSGNLREGAVVMDISGVKGSICRALADFESVKGWTFIGAHPMAGKEKVGYENSCANLFDGASMILTPFKSTNPSIIKATSEFLRTLGFDKIVVTDTEDHDKMIAYTSQLCHLISSAYVREELSARHNGYSAGSFRDMVRVGAPEPDTWTELFFENKDSLLPILDRYIDRLTRFRDALVLDKRDILHSDLEEGVEAKKKIDEEKELK